MLETLYARLIGDTVVAVVKRLRRQQLPGAAEPAANGGQEAGERRRIVNDFGTELGQATMATREAVEAFERHGVLLDPVDWSLADALAEPLLYARAAVERAESDIPRVQLAFGPDTRLGRAASAAIGDLREALWHLREYHTQPGEGEDFSHAERDAARAALERAREQQKAFTGAASRELR